MARVAGRARVEAMVDIVGKRNGNNTCLGRSSSLYLYEEDVGTRMRHGRAHRDRVGGCEAEDFPSSPKGRADAQNLVIDAGNSVATCLWGRVFDCSFVGSVFSKMTAKIVVLLKRGKPSESTLVETTGCSRLFVALCLT